ncbi:MAG TPA: Gfo/Idh/MocA family oxidoreductase [Candidatus Hydrogenedentes bacterium]|nr:Gfo/Idh/MocA family oxidoreductase [Candidatus Hydrogenedentota bacterium]
MLRVAIIGLGPIGNVHARHYKEHPDCDLVGLCDIIPERADEASKRFGAPAFYDAAQMLRDLNPDICGVCTGGHEYGGDHYAPTMQALEAGCHVLGEKPISNEIDKAEAMVRLARERGLCYGINLNHRFTKLTRIARQWVDAGRLGHLLFINMSMWIKNPRETSPWFQLKALHPHTIDVMRHFCGDIAATQCFVTSAPGRKIWSTAHFNFKFACGAVGGLTGSYDIERGHPMERCEVAGTGGRFVLEDMMHELTWHPAGTNEKTIISNAPFGDIPEKTFDDTFRNRIRCFVDQVAAGASPETIDGSGADALAAQRVIAAAITSVEEDSVVEIPVPNGAL